MGSVNLGTINPWSTQGGFNNISFVIQQAISKLQTATLVEILSCTNDGGVSPFGFVDVQPMVSQVDGASNLIPLPIIYGLPYARLQGGSSAIILDPQIGDIGVAVFASRDLSKVKATQSQAGPGSGRQFDLADGMYLGGLLNAAPTQYLQFNSSGVTVVSPNNVTVTAPTIKMGASGSTPQTLMTDAFLSYFTSTVLPALAAHGITIAAPPANSVTTAVEAS
jgi:hypothetical protein